MTAYVDPLINFGSRPKLGYYRLDHSQKLSILLQNTHFVEYPTIEVWEEFRGVVVDMQGAVTHAAEEERKPKRRKLNLKAGKLAINGLLGGYGSDEEVEEEAQVLAADGNVLSMLGGYMGSDDDDDNDDNDVRKVNPDPGLLDTEGEDEDEIEFDPEVLLELMRQVQGSNRGSEDDMVDWGESDEEPE
jgi:hypothetical protein